MAKIFVYDSYNDRFLTYNNLNENAPMPYSYGTTLLTLGKEYSLDYADNIEVGEGKVIVTGATREEALQRAGYANDGRRWRDLRNPLQVALGR